MVCPISPAHENTTLVHSECLHSTTHAHWQAGRQGDFVVSWTLLTRLWKGEAQTWFGLLGECLPQAAVEGVGKTEEARRNWKSSRV